MRRPRKKSSLVWSPSSVSGGARGIKQGTKRSVHSRFGSVNEEACDVTVNVGVAGERVARKDR